MTKTFNQKQEDIIRNQRFALIILLFCVIFALSISVYAVWNIDDVQERCAEYYNRLMVELNCVDNVSGEAWQIGNEIIYNIDIENLTYAVPLGGVYK